jgi:alkylation response protein AidB-like acyl-CoA dehydrogenase
MSTFRVLEEVSRIDAAAGWNLQISVAISPFGAWLPDDGAKEIFAPEVIVAGALFPPAQAIAVPGGYRVTGRTPFVSGCHNATWFLAPAQVTTEGLSNQNDTPVMVVVFFPRADAEIIDNWDTLGMRGTGSHDVAITDRFVPEHRTGAFVPLSTKPPGSAYSGPLYRLTIWPSIVVLAAPALGIARAAIDDLVRLATTKMPAYTGSPLAQRPIAQALAAQAQAHLGAARSYVYEALTEAWETCVAGQLLSMQQRMTLQLAGCHGVQAAATAVRLVHSAAGGTAIRKGHRFERYFRDVHTITQHAFISASRFESVGQLMFGLAPEWPFFAF